MRIIEVCPVCGADIESIEICTNPPIPMKRCTKCDWEWTGEQEETIRVPFNPEGYGHCKITIPKGNYKLKVPMIETVHINL